jgi:5-(carboxyamino)imidazole ribonucleotide synthase
MTISSNDNSIAIGILGSGQLGRMLSFACVQLGLRTHIYAPNAKDSPAGEIAHRTTTAAYDDDVAIATFAASVDVVTSEFENVPAELMNIIADYCPVSPGHAALHTSQHRIREKTLARELGISTPKFWPVTTALELKSAMRECRLPGILKKCTEGYDGKGQVRIKPSDDMEATFNSLGTNDAILEEMVEFVAEASFMVARNAAGDISHFPGTLNNHKNGILAQSTAPAQLHDDILAKGRRAVEKLAKALDLFGLLALEVFVTQDGKLLFNEIAPRPHNSFHWTIEGCATSQFTQLARLLAGMPYGATHTYGNWQMKNLLGEDMLNLPMLLASAGVHVHIYGKKNAKPGRKMGHTNRLLIT